MVKKMAEDLLFKEEVFKIMGCAMKVQDELGNGFLEAVYQEALEIELKLMQIPFESQKRLRINYKGQLLQKEYIADLICFDKIILELKVEEKLTSIDEAQILNYLKVTGLSLGLIINFGSKKKLEWKRFANTQQ